MVSHDHSNPAITVAGGDAEKIITYALLATSILASAVVVAPLALPALGVGQEVEAQLIDKCCGNIPPHTGITEGITQLIDKIPVVGTYLNTSGGNNMLAPVAVMLGGYGAGSLVQHFEKQAGGTGIAGTAIRITSMALGVILSLPALLPGLAHGTLFLGQTTGIDGLDADGITKGPLAELARGIGTNNCAVLNQDFTVPDYAKGEQAFSAVVGAKTSLGLLAGHAACVAPALLALGTTATPAVSQKFTDRVEAKRNEPPAEGVRV